MLVMMCKVFVKTEVILLLTVIIWYKLKIRLKIRPSVVGQGVFSDSDPRATTPAASTRAELACAKAIRTRRFRFETSFGRREIGTES